MSSIGYIGMTGLLFVLILLSLGFGVYPLDAGQILQALIGVGDPQAVIIIQEIRLPRVLLAVLIGGGLALSGAALQGALRNPLADPGILGVSAASSLGAVIAIYYGVAAVSIFAVPLFAMAFGLVATFALLILARSDASVLTLILAGVALSSLAGAATSLVISLAPTALSLQDMVMWMLGSLENRSLTDLWLAAPFIAMGALMIVQGGRHLAALTLSEDVAKSLGVNVQMVQGKIVIGSALIVGAAVSVAGVIGFVGLIVPHMVRPLCGYDPGKSLLPSFFVGAALLVIADMVTRLPIWHGELRLGVVTALIGAPVFLLILLKTRKAMR